MSKILNDNRGLALLLTILVISLIVPFTLQFNTSMRTELEAAANLRDGIKLGYIAKSGFHYALAVLYLDATETTFDSLLEDWADESILSSTSSSLFEDGRFDVKIVDLSGRIQINHLVDEKGNYIEKQRLLLERFLSSEEFELESEDVGNILDAIKDWIDPDNEVTKFGAENAYYQALDKPYACKNGPLAFPEELLLIRGITKELFYGTSEHKGLSNYISTNGQGLININTADPFVLRALSEHMDQELLDDLISYREDEENDLSQVGWYKNIPGMSPEVSIDDLITTSSTYFEIISDGFQNAMKKRITGLVERKEKKIKILSWSVE